MTDPILTKMRDTALRNLPHAIYATIEFPFPPMSGGAVRDYMAIKHLSRDFNIHLAVVSHQDYPSSSQVSESLGFCASITFGSACAAPRPAIQGVRLYHNHVVTERLHELAHEFTPALAHIEGVYSMAIISGLSLPTLVEAQNVEWRVDEMLKSAGQLPRSDLSAGRAYEREAWLSADCLVALTLQDQLDISRQTGLPVTLIPNGWDHLLSEKHSVFDDSIADAPLLLYIGNFYYPPNVSAVAVLMDQVWPKVKRAIPNARLTIAGKGSRARLPDMADTCVELVDSVESVAPLLSRATLMVAPLMSGGGVKVKALEALSMGLPVIASPIAAQGLDEARRAGAVLVGSTPEELAAISIDLLRQPDRLLAARLATREATRRMPRWSHCMEYSLSQWRKVMASCPTSKPVTSEWRCNCGSPFRIRRAKLT